MPLLAHLPLNGVQIRIHHLPFICYQHEALKYLLALLSLCLLNIDQVQFHSVHQSVSQSVSLVGLALVAYAIFAFEKNTPSPSLYTLIPTIGAGLVLVFADNKNLVGKLLGSKLFVGVGLISYSAYLWHQPLLAFARLRSIDEDLGKSELVFLCVSTIAIAFLSWKFIENPFRTKKYIPIKVQLILCAMLTLIFTVVGLIGYMKEGLNSRFPDQAQLYIKYYSFDNWYKPLRFNECHLQDINIVNHAIKCYEKARPLVALWGDSHASALYPGLKKLQTEQNFGITQLTQASCPPISNVGNRTRLNCDKINQNILIELESEKPEVLILHSRWMLNGYHYTKEQLKTKLIDMLHKIKKSLPTTKVVIIGPVPRWRFSPQKLSYIYWLNNQDKDVPKILEAIQLKQLDMELSKISESENVSYVSVLQALCNQEGCIARLGNTIDDFVQIDYEHLSQAGSEFLIESIKNDIVVNFPKEQNHERY